MIKLICFIKRKPGMDPAEFHDYWRNVHGPLVCGTESGSYALRYEQNHKPLSAYAHDDTGWDGVTEQWFESVSKFYESISVPDYKTIEEDIAKFMDPTQIQFMLTEVPEVIKDGPTS